MVIAHASPVEHGLLVVTGIVSVASYGWAWLRLDRASAWRLTAWCVGVAVLIVSVMPVMERWAQRSFTGHMVQHLAMIVVAAPLLVVAKSVMTFRTLGWLPRRTTATERAVARRWRAHGAIGSAAAFVLVLYATHLTGIYDAALRNRFVHDVEHVAYIGSAIALWAALRSTGRDAALERVGAVFGVIGGSALLGVVLISASSPLVDTYTDRLGIVDALADQRAAASLMWVGGMATTLPLLLLSVWSWASTEDRIAHRQESLTDARAGDRVRSIPERHGASPTPQPPG